MVEQERLAAQRKLEHEQRELKKKKTGFAQKYRGPIKVVSLTREPMIFEEPKPLTTQPVVHKAPPEPRNLNLAPLTPFIKDRYKPSGFRSRSQIQKSPQDDSPFSGFSQSRFEVYCRRSSCILKETYELL